MNYQRPNTLDEAVSLLSTGGWTMLSGGTDYYPGLGDQPPSGNILDVSQIDGLKDITVDKDGAWHIGAAVTWTDIIQADLPAAFDGLKLAALEVGSVQIQNRATLVGNICNASPAADGVPPLLTLDASVRLASASKQRTLALSEFILGNRQIALQDDELVTAIVIPKPSGDGISNFVKLGARKYLVISIAMVAMRLELDQHNTIQSAAISIGSCSLIAKRLHALEQALIGVTLDENTGDIITRAHISELSPIDDVRAPADYRLTASVELLKQALFQLHERA